MQTGELKGNLVMYVDVRRAGDCITMALSHRVNIHTKEEYGGKIMHCTG